MFCRQDYLTWKDILLSILGGYISLTVFFVVTKYTALSFLFYGKYDQVFYERLYYLTMVIFYAVFTVYATTIIISFSFRRNKYFSGFCDSVNRFIESYALCLWIGFIPFCIWIQNIFYRVCPVPRFCFYPLCG